MEVGKNRLNRTTHFLSRKGKEDMINNITKFKDFVSTKISVISAETFGWLAAIVLHAATIPSLLAIMSGLTDRLPSVDLVLLVWTGLFLLFVKAAIQKDMLNLVTIGIGFIIQSVLMALIFFK
jgi:hypothetical protein